MALSLEGHRVLIAEDEPIIAFDLAQAVEAAGAKAVVVHSLKHALAIARVEPLSAAAIDIKLKGDVSSPLCALLQCRDVPFVIYTDAREISGFRFTKGVITKPAEPDVIVNTLAILATPKVSRSQRRTLPTLADRVARARLPKI